MLTRHLLFVGVFAVLAGCAPTPETPPSRLFYCGEFSVELPGDWYREKEVPRTDGVHLVKIRGASHNTTINFYVYPKNSGITPVSLNDYFFGELSAVLQTKGQLTSGAPVDGKLVGRPAVTRHFRFVMGESEANFDLHTAALSMAQHDFFVLAQIRTLDQEVALRELAIMLDSIKELSGVKPAKGARPPAI